MESEINSQEKRSFHFSKGIKANTKMPKKCRDKDKSHSKKKKKKHHKRSYTSSSNSSDTLDDASGYELTKVRKKRKHKNKKRKRKHSDTYERKTKKRKPNEELSNTDQNIPLELSKVSESAPKRLLAPVTKEEYEKQQSVIQRVYDEDTKRHRLVRGSGEIVEEIVSKERHKQINQEATRGDGMNFQVTLQQFK